MNKVKKILNSWWTLLAFLMVLWFCSALAGRIIEINTKYIYVVTGTQDGGCPCMGEIWQTTHLFRWEWNEIVGRWNECEG